MASSGSVSVQPATTVYTPQRQPPAVSPMTSTASPSKVTTATLTIEAALASANGSLQTALEAVIAERNSLSGQNSQLWKLIEKQRVGYANVLKEVERLKAERDRAYAKLDGEHGPRRAKDRPSPVGSDMMPRERERTASHSTPTGPRPQPHRHQSDGPEESPRDHDTSASKSFDPHRPVNGTGPHMPHATSLDHFASSDPVVPPPRKGSISSQQAPTLPLVAPLSFGSRSAKADPPAHGPLPVFNTPPQADAIPPPMAPASLHNQSLSPTQPMLGPYSQPDDSRGSRITLPDEASRYIANMQDSPMPSPIPAPGDLPPPPPHATGVNGPSNAIESARHHHPPPTVVVQPLEDHADSPSKEFPSHIDFDDDLSDDDRNNMPVPPTLITDHDATPTQPHPSASSGRQNEYDQQHSREYLDASPSLSSQSHMYNLNRASPTSDDESRNSSPLREHPPQQIASHSPNSRPPHLSASELVYTAVKIVGSNIRANDRGKEVLSFVVEVLPPDREHWKIEKLYSDVLALDSKVRAKLSRSQIKKIAPLPDAKLFKDNAPAKVDQRKNVLEAFLRSLLTAPLKDPSDVSAFFTTDIIRAEARAGVGHSGFKEGYLTKRGKNFGGWKTRYFVLQSSVLEYYESRGGTHLGSIAINGAQIGRQQKAASSRDPDDENAYRHAFLIIEARRGPNGANTRHVLCAESDVERDSWVEVLVRYVVANPDENASLAPDPAGSLPRSSTSSSTNLPETASGSRPRQPPRGLSKDEISRGQAVPISQLATDTHHPKLFPVAPPPQAYSDSSSPSTERAGIALTDAQVAHKLLHRGPTPNMDGLLSSSLPESNPLSQVQQPMYLASKRSNSEMGHYADLKAPPSAQSVMFPETPAAGVAGTPRTASAEGKHRHRASYQPSMASARLAPIADPPSPDSPSGGLTPTAVAAKKVISGPSNGMTIPAGYKFGQKESPVNTEPVAPTGNDRATKVKSKFWPAFGRSDKDKNHATEKAQTTSMGGSVVPIGRAVFGVSLQQSLGVAEMANLPAVVFRCIEYLEAKKADQEEGIYRLSGSSAVIKNLRDRFNMEGDIDLLKDDEYWDPHAIAGLLKTFLRELPSSILTRELHMRFLSVIDLMDPQERIAELATLIAALPPPNYALLRALTAHLILVVQNAGVNKMNMRNVGIVFSPTLGIPAGVFSLMLGEFNRVFNVDGSLETSTASEFPVGSTDMPESNAAPPPPRPVGSSKRNSQLYADGAADMMLGLGGRSLPADADDSDDGGQSPILEESEGENETEEGGPISVLGSSAPSESSSPPTTPGPQTGYHQPGVVPDPSNTLSPTSQLGHSGHAKDVAVKHGLQISTSTATPVKQKRMSYLPTSPRPPGRHAGGASATMKDTPINESPR